MCRLTLVATKNNNQKLGFLIASKLMMLNSQSHGQDDGCGIFYKSKTEEGLITSSEQAFKFMTDSKFKEFVNSLKFDSDGIIIGHVRQASVGISVSKENSHPFNLKNIVGAHNGTISNKETFCKNIESDSKAFFMYMDNLSDNGLSYEIIKECTDKLKGSFCFLIHDKVNNDTYVVTGKNRELYFSKSDDILLINTDQDVLEFIIGELNVLLLLLGQNNIKFSEVVKLPENSVFKLDGIDLVKIGDVKENSIETVKYSTKYEIQSQSSVLSVVRKWREILNTTKLDWEDISVLVESFYGVTVNSWVDLDNAIIEDMFDVISSMKEKSDFFKDLEEKEKLWNNILFFVHDNSSGILVYDKVSKLSGRDIEFPFWANTVDELKQILDGILQ